jgi:hypothetical protein
MKTDNQQPMDLKDLLHKIKSGEMDHQAHPLSEIARDARKNLKLSRQQFYKNLTTFQWGHPHPEEYISSADQWHHEISFDRRAMIDDGAVLLLAWPWRSHYPNELREHTDFLGYRMVDEFSCEALIRVTDEDTMWLWRQHFISLDKETYL